MNVLFKNIRLISPLQNIDKHVNLHILDGIILNCDSNEVHIDSNTQVIPADDLIAAPGFIDMHVHLRDPGFTNKETIITGAEAAANGGFTEIVCMPNTSPAIDSIPVMDYINNKSKNLPVTVKISCSITQGREGKNLTSMLALHEAGAVFFTDDGSCVREAEVMKRAFDYVAPKDLLLSQHCEEHSLTTNFSMNEGEISLRLGLKGYPYIAEEIIIERDIKLAKYAGNRRYHVQHVSTAGAVDIIKKAKEEGLRISCEVTPHHLWFTEDELQNYDSNYKMNPPLRKQSDVDALVNGIKDGTIDCIASDHAPHSLYDCDVEFENVPNGVIGLETELGAILTKLYHQEGISLSKIIELISINPRKIMALSQIIFEKGNKANISIFSPDEEWQVNVNKFKSKAVNTPFNDKTFLGKPKYIINNNQLISSSL